MKRNSNLKLQKNNESKNKQIKFKEIVYLIDEELGKNFQSYFIEKNVKLRVGINNNLDIVVEVASKMEYELFEELSKAFPE